MYDKEANNAVDVLLNLGNCKMYKINNKNRAMNAHVSPARTTS